MPRGTWASAPDERGWGALLAHRRLSILDLSPAGAQPMTDPVTGHVISFNGEIYNFADLRQRLMSEGQQFNSTGDTAVMLRALGLHGPEAVKLAARHVRVRLLGPGQAPAPAGAGSARHQASLCGARIGSRRRLVAGICIGASGPAGLGAFGYAATRSAGCCQRRVERLRGWPRNSREGRRASAAGPAASNSTALAAPSATRISGRSPITRLVRAWTRTSWPLSWRRA